MNQAQATENRRLGKDSENKGNSQSNLNKHLLCGSANQIHEHHFDPSTWKRRPKQCNEPGKTGQQWSQEDKELLRTAAGVLLQGDSKSPFSTSNTSTGDISTQSSTGSYSSYHLPPDFISREHWPPLP
jgi:hypothetical protein